MVAIAIFAISCDQATEASNAVKDTANKAGETAKEMVKSPLAKFNGSYKIDAAKSKVTWVGKKVTGKHMGSVDIANGMLGFADGNINKGIITVDMTSISVTDLKAGEGKEDLEGHLKSADFFGVDTHKTAVFNVKSANMDGLKGVVSGDLVIKGKSNPAEINIDVDANMPIPSIIGTLTFDRTAYDIQYGSGKFFDDLGDKMINDEVSMKFNLALTK